MRRITLIAALVLIATAGFAFADDAKAPVPQAATVPPVIKTSAVSFDADGDGTITVVESEAFWEGQFNAVDLNKDGKVTVDEFLANKNAIFEQKDTNKDGVLVGQEFVVTWCSGSAKYLKNAVFSKIKKFDADGDGKLSRAECEVMYSGVFNESDTNSDGRVELKEFMDSLKERFSRMDKNKDGFVDFKEFMYYWTDKGRETLKPEAVKPPAAKK
jgi:Ca2+-binding EF-hand superfamily protein